MIRDFLLSLLLVCFRFVSVLNAMRSCERRKRNAPGSVTSQLENLSSEVLENGGEVDCDEKE